MLDQLFHKMTIWGYVRRASAHIRLLYVTKEPQKPPKTNVEHTSLIEKLGRERYEELSKEIEILLKPDEPVKIDKTDEEEGSRYKYSHRNTSENPNKDGIKYQKKYSLAPRDSLEDKYDEERISNAMKKYSFLNESEILFDVLDQSTNKTFVDAMMIHMRRNELQPATVYKMAHIDRKLFSKIISDRNYKPSKDTAIAIILALNLTLDEANDLLERAGYAFSHSNKKDIIIEYFIRERIYNLNDINEVLYKLDQKIVGK